MRLVKRDVRVAEIGESIAAIRQKRQWRRQLLTAACVAGIGGAAERAVAATVTWTGAAGDKNWSDPGNWTGGVPAGNDILFTSNGAATAPNTVNNIVDATTA